jgi:glutathione S-transferase
MSWTNERMEPALHMLVMEFSRLSPERRSPDAARNIVNAITPALETLDARLAASPYVAGTAFSMGDIPAGAAAYRWKVFGLSGPATPHLDAWLDELATREGFRHHVAPRDFQL